MQDNFSPPWIITRDFKIIFQTIIEVYFTFIFIWNIILDHGVFQFIRPTTHCNKYKGAVVGEIYSISFRPSAHIGPHFRENVQLYRFEGACS